jgi:hypothetical protein
MSELMNTNHGAGGFRWELLATVSVLALSAVIAMPPETSAHEDDRDKPTVWIEVGGQLERNDGIGAPFTPAFMQFKPTPAPFKTASPIDVQHAPRYSKGAEATIVLEPSGSDWVFSASVRYGRSNGNKHVIAQTHPERSKYLGPAYGRAPIGATQIVPQFADTTVRLSETHTVLDFNAGKDVGLGIFGRDSTSIFSLGVRFAQFVSRADVQARTRQNIQVTNIAPPPKYVPNYKFHTYYLKANNERSFNGIGPSLSWQASAPLTGDLQDGEFALDWGFNGAILFGRQKAKLHHHTQDSYNKGIKYTPPSGNFGTHYKRYVPVSGNPQRSRSVIVPNIGAFAGLSYRIENFKVSAGYRADFFFNAIDGGIDTRQEFDRSFHGPFALFSVGL